MNPSFLARAPRIAQWKVAGSMLLAVAFGVAPQLAAAHGDKYRDEPIPRNGQWMIDPGHTNDEIELSIKAGSNRHYIMNWTTSAPLKDLGGFNPRSASKTQGEVEFRIARDAGTFVCSGVFDGGHGAGVFTLELDKDFPNELAKRGIRRPTADEQARLAYANAGIALLDELKKQSYETPDLDTF